jgi:hypothetical protein
VEGGAGGWAAGTGKGAEEGMHTCPGAAAILTAVAAQSTVSQTATAVSGGAGTVGASRNRALVSYP